MKPHRSSFVVVSALLLAMTAACGSDSSSTTVAEDCEPTATFDTISEGKLTVAAPDSPPRFFGDPSDPEGIDPTLIKKFAEATCLEVVWNVVPQPSVIETVRSKRADIAAGGWYRTEERGEIVGQSYPVLADIPTIISAEASDSLDDFESVGTVTGFLWVDDLKGVYGEKVSLFQSADAVINGVKDGRVEFGLFSGVDGPYLAEQANAGLKATPMASDPRVAASQSPGWVNIPFEKSNAALGEALDQEIRTWHQTGFIETTIAEYGIDAKLADVSGFEG